MSLNRPAWPHTSIEVLEQIASEVAKRLNSDAQPGALWKVEYQSGQLALSKPGALRVIWSLIGGRIERGFQAHGQQQPAKCVATRNCRLQAEIRVMDQQNVGITRTDLMLAEEVLRAIILVWDHQRPADFDSEEQEETWEAFTEDVGQREVICRYRVTIQLLVHDDPHLFKTIDSISASGEVVQP
jgi:hypothetical protein